MTIQETARIADPSVGPITPITQADLAWWLNETHELDWVFAVTYAESAPHEYICDRTAGMTPEDFVRACRVIRTFGVPKKYFKWTRIYLEDDAGWHYWDMEGADPTTCNLINRARSSHVYGAQNAPNTAAAQLTPYDGLATFWDAGLRATELERDAFRTLAADLGDFTRRRVLDVGCGTGLTLDLGITDAVRYTGVDRSQAMLNELVRKYPLVARVEPTTLADAIARRALGGTRFALVTALGGSASYLTEGEWGALSRLGEEAFLLSVYAEGEEPGTGDLTQAQLADARARLNTFANQHSGRVERVGRFDVIAVRPEPAFNLLR